MSFFIVDWQPITTTTDKNHVVSNEFLITSYGDLCPTTAAAKVFTCFFGVAGISLLGAALATICSTFVEAEVEAVKKVEDAGKKQILSLFRDMPGKLAKFRHASQEEREKLLSKVEKRKQKRLQLAMRAWSNIQCLAAVGKALPSLSIIFGGGLVLGYLNGGWNVLESLYYSVITGE